MTQTRLQQKPVAVVSGGMGFLGRAIVRRLSVDGFLVATLYHATPVAEADSFCESTGIAGAVSTYRCDLTDSRAINLTLAEVEQEIGPIVVAIHCAQSPIIRKKVMDISLQEFKEQFSVPVFGGFDFFKAIVSLMKPRSKGTIIGVSTVMLEDDKLPKGSFGGYVSVKSALKGLLMEIAASLEQTGIRVHVVSPSFMDGGMNANLPARLIEFMKEASPNGRLLEPEDVAESVSRLCMTGETSAPFVVIVDKPMP